MVRADCFPDCKVRRMRRNSGSYRAGPLCREWGVEESTYFLFCCLEFIKQGGPGCQKFRSARKPPATFKDSYFQCKFPSDNNMSQYRDFENEFAAPQ